MAERRRQNEVTAPEAKAEPRHSATELNRFLRDTDSLVRRYDELKMVIREGMRLEAELDQLQRNNETLQQENAALLATNRDLEGRNTNLEATIAAELEKAREQYVQQVRDQAQPEVDRVLQDAEAIKVQAAAELAQHQERCEGETARLTQTVDNLRREHGRLEHAVQVLQSARDALQREVVGAS